MRLMAPDKIQVVLSLESGRILRPVIVLEEIFRLPEDIIQGARILKTDSVTT
jgi:hypothetical protein